MFLILVQHFCLQRSKHRYKLVFEAETDLEMSSPPRAWYRLCSGCLPFWLLRLLLLVLLTNVNLHGRVRQYASNQPQEHNGFISQLLP